ncbi:hypothetical protein V8G54_024323 [Vigna mungo]|uniref:Uncharacterized protein n=1 Tax=Vigna mungo TaxID=3915 RepID=A0AAQ3N6P9_VIGMU
MARHFSNGGEEGLVLHSAPIFLFLMIIASLSIISIIIFACGDDNKITKRRGGGASADTGDGVGGGGGTDMDREFDVANGGKGIDGEEGLVLHTCIYIFVFYDYCFSFYCFNHHAGCGGGCCAGG